MMLPLEFNTLWVVLSIYSVCFCYIDVKSTLQATAGPYETSPLTVFSAMAIPGLNPIFVNPTNK